jgi:hypothetical protein
MRVTSIGGLATVALLLLGCGSGPDVPFGVRATETVWCADRDGTVDTVTWDGHDGELTAVDVKIVELAVGSVSDGDLIGACSRPWPWRASATDTLCEAYTTAARVEQFTAEELVNAVHGEPTDQRPGFPVVIRGDVDCDNVRLQVGPESSVSTTDGTWVADPLRPWNSTDRFNQWRAAERRFAAASDHGCLDADRAHDIALSARDDLPGDWPVLESTSGADDASHAGLCFDVRLHRSGIIQVEYHSHVSPPGPASLTDQRTTKHRRTVPPR